MGAVHRPYFRRNRLGGIEIWFTDCSEVPCCDHRLDHDVESAVDQLKRFKKPSTCNLKKSEAEGVDKASLTTKSFFSGVMMGPL